jgi:hypothetical protein
MTLLVRVISNEDAIKQHLIIRLMGRADNRFLSDSHWPENWIIVHMVNSARSNQGLKEAGNSFPRNFNYNELWGQPLVPNTVTVGEHSNRFFWDSHWLDIWSNHFCPSMGPNGGSVATDSGWSINSSLTSFLTGLGPFAVP